MTTMTRGRPRCGILPSSFFSCCSCSRGSGDFHLRSSAREKKSKVREERKVDILLISFGRQSLRQPDGFNLTTPGSRGGTKRNNDDG